MRFIVLLLSVLYIAIMFAFVGAVAGFLVGFVSMPLFGADLSSLPLFGAGGAVTCSVWGFARVFRGDAATTTFAEAAPRNDNWVASHSIDPTRVAADEVAAFDSVHLVDSLDPSTHADQPRCMIDAFTFGDNLYEAVYEASTVDELLLA